MRLVTCILIAWIGGGVGPLEAQEGRPLLPWDRLRPLDWQAGPPASRLDPPQGEPSTGPRSVWIAGDGALQVMDGRGVVRLRAGLPGRPLRAWRDGGLPLAAPKGTWAFPEDTPLSQGLGELRWCAEDFRPFLRGLLWILEDGESVLTVVHPATAQVTHLPLPQGQDLDLHFRPDRLEVVSRTAAPAAPQAWSIPWIGLLPRLATLGTRANPGPQGTALNPFPRS